MKPTWSDRDTNWIPPAVGGERLTVYATEPPILLLLFYNFLYFIVVSLLITYNLFTIVFHLITKIIIIVYFTSDFHECFNYFSKLYLCYFY